MELVAALVAFVVLVLWVLVGSVVYHLLEDWSVGEGVYFCMVTLSTVVPGLGRILALCHRSPTLYHIR